MGLLGFFKRSASRSQSQPQNQPSYSLKGWINPHCSVSQASDLGRGWEMPRYRGLDICDWIPEIGRSKREGEWDRALSLAVGCMNAMIDAAVRNSGNVMEYYVIQVAIIQHRMKAYNDEVLTVQNWLSLGLPAPREDYRIKLRIRLAKAQELVAKSEGRDSTHYHNEWKCLVELGRINKAHKTSCSRVSTGYSIVHPEVSYRRSSSGVHPTGKKVRSPSLIPRRSDLKASTFAAVDFETANESYVSACQVALVLMREGEVVDRYSTYLKPPRGYDYFKNTKLHGIGVKEVLCAPTWLDVSAVISRFIGDVPVWAHNSSFDSGVWRKLDEYYGICTRPRRFYCSLWASKKIIPGLVSYELPIVLRECDPSFHLDHHRADSDAEACARIVCALQRLA